MKTLCLLFLLLIGTATISNAQSILAGSYEESDYYFDVTPDFVLINGGDNNTNGNKYPIDLNGDDILDISITGNIMGWNYRIGDISVIAEEHCKVAFGRIDTIVPNITEGECSGATDKYFTITHCFSLMDTINNSVHWSDSIHHYIKYEYLQLCHPTHSDSISSAIIGVQLRVDTDTLYGWIKLNDMLLAPFDGARVTIEEYACNSQFTGIDEINSLISIFPNPCKDFFSVELTRSYTDGEVSIYNMNGYKLLEKQVNSPNLRIDLGQLKNGIYLVKLYNGESYSYKKIVKM
ncbi:T9SS type A sorting domain-containing protein [uncultured Draconibacterium sp.]|uniref:T9SS type A sorting domain-containing protein n=1 Tax=uncultured Draconibacterium sp. TaxID=1573823 RepID=UPI002AA8209A|nr:T9SS type A sorting domain-containing protein [uncultured Draconibacterium sp.]